MYKILTGNNLEMPEEEETNPADMMDTEINSLLEVDIGGTTINAIKVCILYTYLYPQFDNSYVS